MIKKKDFELVLEFAVNDFKLKYRNNLFGYAWSIVNPLLMLITLYVVFSFIMKLSVPYYQLFLLLGIIIWNYFSQATNNSLGFLAANANILKKHKIKPAIIVISSCLSNLIGLFLSFLVFFIMLIIFKTNVSPFVFISIIYLIMLFLFTVGIALIISGIYGYFKDITHLWSFSLLIGFWVSPIIYSEMIIPDNLRKFYMLNPVARIISHLRNIFIYDYVDTIEQILITLLLCLIILFFGLWIFKYLSKDFGEKL